MLVMFSDDQANSKFFCYSKMAGRPRGRWSNEWWWIFLIICQLLLIIRLDIDGIFLFITAGDSGLEDEDEDEEFGDFEDLETGEKFEGKPTTKDGADKQK